MTTPIIPSNIIPRRGVGYGGNYVGVVSPANKILYSVPLLSDIIANRGVGAITYTRASTLYEPDFAGIDRPVVSGSSAFGGLRPVTNLQSNPDISTWTRQTGVTVDSLGSGVYRINFNNNFEGVYQTVAYPVAVGTQAKYSMELMSESVGGTVFLDDSTGSSIITAKALTVTTSWKRFCNTAGTATISYPNIGFWIKKNAGGLSSVLVRFTQIENVTGQANQNPGDYVATTSTPVTKFFEYANPNTVDGNGVVTDSGVRTPVYTSLGIVSTAAVTNKVTCYSVPRADSVSAELITVAANRTFASDTGFWTFSGTSAIGSGVANIKGTTDQGMYLATLSTISSNPVGKFFTYSFKITRVGSGGLKLYSGNLNPTVIDVTGGLPKTITLTAQALTNGAVPQLSIYGIGATDIDIDDFSIVENYDYVGTKAYVFTGSTFTNPITNMTLSGDTAAVLSIVTDSTALTTALADSTLQMRGAIQQAIDNGGKVYKVVNGATASIVKFEGTVVNTNTHIHYILYHGGGSSDLRGNNSGGIIGLPLVAGFTMVKSASYTPDATTRYMLLNVQPNETIFFLVPSLIEAPYVPQSPYIPTSGAAFARSATVTSSAYQLASTGTRHLRVSWTPTAVSAGKVQTIFSNYTDASNEFSCYSNGVIVYLLKKVAGVSEYVTFDLVLVVKTEYTIDAYIYPDGTLGLGVNGTMQTGTLGSELITVTADRDFSSNTGNWGLDTGITIGSGTLNFSTAGTANAYRSILTVGKVYRQSIDVLTLSLGAVSFAAGTNVGPSLTVGTGKYTDILAAGTVVTGAFVNIRGVGATIATLDNYSLKQVYNNSTTLTPVLANTIQIGSSASLLQAEGYFKNFTVLNR